MLIAWQTINAVRQPGSTKFTRGFLVVTPGITIRDRLRVLQPNDPDSYYATRELVPADMLADIDRAKIVITNYHAFKLRERIDISKGGRALLQGRGPAAPDSRNRRPDAPARHARADGHEEHPRPERRGASLLPRKPRTDEVEELEGRRERTKPRRTTKPHGSGFPGMEAVKRKLGLTARLDLSATPFFLRGSGYAEGTLFPWTVSDFSLMDAIECGIVKLPRVPVADNFRAAIRPIFRNLWEHIGKKMPKKGPREGGKLDPLSLPVELQTALDALYGHYQKTFDLWEDADIEVPPVFIVVCNNTATSKLVYDYISGFQRENDDGPAHSKTAASRFSGTTTTTATAFRVRARFSSTVSNSNRRSTGQRLSGNGVGRDRSLPPRDRRAHRRHPALPTTSPIRTCCAR